MDLPPFRSLLIFASLFLTGCFHPAANSNSGKPWVIVVENTTQTKLVVSLSFGNGQRVSKEVPGQSRESVITGKVSAELRTFDLQSPGWQQTYPWNAAIENDRQLRIRYSGDGNVVTYYEKRR